jgi:hypothetical protein
MKRVFERMTSPEKLEISNDEKAAEDPFVTVSYLVHQQALWKYLTCLRSGIK